MNTHNLNNLNLKELSKQEMSTTSGGLVWLPFALATAIIISAINNFGDIRQGLMDGWNGTPRHIN